MFIGQHNMGNGDDGMEGKIAVEDAVAEKKSAKSKGGSKGGNKGGNKGNKENRTRIMKAADTVEDGDGDGWGADTAVVTKTVTKAPTVKAPTREVAAKARLESRRSRASRKPNEMSVEDMGGTIIEDPESMNKIVAGAKEEAMEREIAAHVASGGSAKDGTAGGIEEIKDASGKDVEHRKFESVRVVATKKKALERRATDDSGGGSGRDDDSGGGYGEPQRMTDIVAEHLVDFLMDPPAKNLPIVTILPSHALNPIVSAETMATLPYRYYIGRNEVRRDRAREMAKNFNAPLFLIKRRDIRSMGVKGQARADGVSMFQIRSQEAQGQKPLFPSDGG